jgi:hypothetical protein
MRRRRTCLHLCPYMPFLKLTRVTAPLVDLTNYQGTGYSLKVSFSAGTEMQHLLMSYKPQQIA